MTRRQAVRREARAWRAHLIGWAVVIGFVLLIAALDSIIGGGVVR